MPIYMQVPGIDGNVSAKGHEKFIEIDRMQFGVGRGITDATPGTTSNREASIAGFSEVSISKIMDETTPKFFIESCIGKAKDKVVIRMCRTGDDIKPYMEYTLHNVLISKYSVNGSGDAHPGESMSLNFDKIEMKYTPFDDKHAPGSPVPAGYDLKTAQKV